MKTRHDWVGKVFHWELFKKLTFDHTNKPESILENEMHKILWDFEKQADHLISARQPDLRDNQQKNESLLNSELCRPDRPQSKIERKGKER